MPTGQRRFSVGGLLKKLKGGEPPPPPFVPLFPQRVPSAEPVAPPPASVVKSSAAAATKQAIHRGTAYAIPPDLTVSGLAPRHIVMIGSCLLEAWGFHEENPSATKVDLIAANHLSGLPEKTAAEISAYDFQIVQIPLRAILSDDLFWRADPDDDSFYENTFRSCCASLALLLADHMAWNVNSGLLSFVGNFMVPQQNPLGRLFPRYRLSNIEYFIDRLNQELERLVAGYKNAYVLDIERISAMLGRRVVQGDSITSFSHGALLGPLGPVSTRIEPLAGMADYYSLGLQEFGAFVWNELLAMYRTVRESDPVKLVIADLDDTLRDGISGDISELSGDMVEGWPLGLIEALMYLKKRGVLLAIASKNEDSRIHETWPRIFGNRLRLEDFAAVRINGLPKTENVRTILDTVNVPPGGTVFIGGNPAERGAMQAAFPEMRVIGGTSSHLRRVLLWSAETQVVPARPEKQARQPDRATSVSPQPAAFRIDFTANGNSGTYVAGGWSGSEPHHRWATGQESILRLPPLDFGRCLLSLRAWPYERADKSLTQSLTVEVNGQALERFLLKGIPTRYATWLPEGVLSRTSENRIKLIHPEAEAPIETGGTDKRALAMAVMELSIEPVTIDLFEQPVLLPHAPFAFVDHGPMITRFQSLGQNCEFGLVQRRCGAEPLGLLRFSSIFLPQLLRGIESKFAGIDEPGNLSFTATGPGAEYIGRHKIYGLDYHTFKHEGSTGAEELKKTELKRLPYLARVLMEQIEGAEKIFVIQRGNNAFSQSEILQLLRLLRSYNPDNILLWVSRAPDADPGLAGRVEQLGPGFFLGHLDRFAPPQDAHDLSFHCWVEICTAVDLATRGIVSSTETQEPLQSPG